MVVNRMKWICFSVGFLSVFVDRAVATWSICIGDSRTKEVAVGSVTCIEDSNLLALLPVLVVGKGTGASQALIDSNGAKRIIIHDGLIAGTSPADILAQLALQGGHQFRQYGIADTMNQAITFSGSSNSQWAGGVTGTEGDFTFAIQGNILSGDCIVPAIENAVRTTPGDIPAKLMAGMQAAKANGGDGRCSCPGGTAPCSPCPPSSFTKAGHIGTMLVGRIGDTDDPVCNGAGCADGDYFLKFNVANQFAADPDPVDQLQGLFDAWRTALTGRPDAVQSSVLIAPDEIDPFVGGTAKMTITLRDWSGAATTATIQSVQVTTAPGSPSISSIGSPVDMGGGVYSVTLTAGFGYGEETLRVTVDDGVRPVVLMPDAKFLYLAPPAPAMSSVGYICAVAGLLLAGGVFFAARYRRTTSTSN